MNGWMDGLFFTSLSDSTQSFTHLPFHPVPYAQLYFSFPLHSLTQCFNHSLAPRKLTHSLTHSFNRSFLTSPTYSLWQLLTQQPLELLYGQNGVVLRAVVKVVRHFGHVPRHRPAQRNPDRLTGRRLDRLQEERAGSGQENRT